MSNILHLLQTAPSEYERLTTIAIEAEAALKTIRAKLAANRAAMTLKHREAKNASIMQALVENEPEIQDMVLEEIAKEAEAKIARNKAQRADNDFTAARKLATLSEEAVKAANGIGIHSHNVG